MATETTRLQLEFTGADAVVNGWRQIAAAARAAQREMQADAAKVSAGFKALNAGVISLKSEALALTSQLGPAGAALTALGPAGIAAGVGFAAVAGGVAAVTKASADFNKALSQLSAITGATGKDLDFLKDKAFEFGRTTTLSATAAVDAFRLIGSAKPELLGNAEALAEVTKQARILAEASGLDLPAAAKALADTLNQLGLAADQAGRVVNVLAAGALKGAAEIPEFNEALLRSGTAAAQARIPVEQLTATLQLLLQFGRGGDVTGTGLRTILAKLGQGASETRPSVVGLSKALENLEKQIASGVNVYDLFDDKAADVALQLLQIRKQIDPFASGLTGTNTALESASKVTDNLAGDLKRLGTAYETLSTQVGEITQGPMREFVQGLRDAVNAIGEIVTAKAAPGGLLDQFQHGVLLRGESPNGDPSKADIDKAFRDLDRRKAAGQDVSIPTSLDARLTAQGLTRPAAAYGPDLPPGFDAKAAAADVLKQQAEADAIVAQATRKAETGIKKLNREYYESIKNLDDLVVAGTKSYAQTIAARAAIDAKYAEDKKKLDHEGNKLLTERVAILGDIAKAEKDAAVAGADVTSRVERERDAAIVSYQRSVAGQKNATLEVTAFAVAEEQKAQAAILASKTDQLRKAADAEIAAEKDKIDREIKGEGERADLLGQFRTAKETELAAKVAELREKGLNQVTDAERKFYDEQQRLAEENAKQLSAPFLEAGRAIQATLGDALTGVFDGSVNSAGSAADAIKHIFQRLAAELAALAIGRIIIGPALTSLGLGGVAQQLGVSNQSGLGLGGAITGLLGLGSQSSSGTLSALLGTGAATSSAIQRGTSGQGFGVADALGYVGTVNQAANLGGYGASLSGSQGAGLYFNGSPIYSLSGGFGGAAAGGSLGAIGGLGAIPGAVSATTGGIAGTTLVFDAAGNVIGVTGGAFGAGASIAPEAASSIAAQYAASGTTTAGTTLGGAAPLIGAAGTVLAAAGLVYSLYEGGKGIADTRSGYDAVTHGTAGRQRDTLTSVQSGLVAGFTAGGAAAGAVAGAPLLGIGAIPGAIIGAGVGAGIGSALSSALGSGINQGIGGAVSHGATQDALNKRIQSELGKNGTLDVISAVLNPINLLVRKVLPGLSLEGLVGAIATPDIEKIFDKILQETVEKSTGGTFNKNLGDRLGQGPARRENLGRFESGGSLDDETRFFTRLIATNIGAGTDDPDRLRRFRTLIANNLGNKDRPDEEVVGDLQGVIRQLVRFGPALKFVNASFLEARSTQLRADTKGQGDFQSRATDVVGAYLGRGGLPAKFDVDAVVRRVLDEQGYLSKRAIVRDAGYELRDEAERTGQLTFDPASVSTRKPRIFGKKLRGAGKKRRARRQAVDQAQDAAIDTIDKMQRALVALQAPGEAVTQRFGDIQTSLNAINALTPKNLEELPGLVQNATQAIAAYGDALNAQFDAARQARSALQLNYVTRREETDALTRNTTTHLAYNDVLAQAETNLRRAQESGKSATVQLAAVNQVLGLIRQQGQAEITDIQEGAQAKLDKITRRNETIGDRLEVIGPLAQLSSGLHDQLKALTDAQRGTTPTRQLALLARELRGEKRDYASAGDEVERAQAASQIQQTIQKQLELAGQTYGTGSAEYRRLQGAAIRTLKPIEKTAGSYEEEALKYAKEQRDLAVEQRTIERDTRDKILAVQARVAHDLEAYGKLQPDLLRQQYAASLVPIEKAFPNEDITALLDDSTASQALVAARQLAYVKTIADGTTRLVNIAEGRPADAPADVPAADAVPYLAGGGDIVREGLAYVHAGERVQRASDVRRGGGTGGVVVHLGGMVVNVPAGTTPRDAQLIGAGIADAFERKIAQSARFGELAKFNMRKAG